VGPRRIGGVPTYLLTDNERTVIVEHVTGIPIRDRAAVEFGRALWADPWRPACLDSSVEGRSESTGPEYGSFAQLEAACRVFCEQANGRPHRSTRSVLADLLGRWLFTAWL
jgi:hypothetical protein